MESSIRLIQATKKGDIEEVKRCLKDAECDINFRKSMGKKPSIYTSALCWCIGLGNMKIFELLLQTPELDLDSPCWGHLNEDGEIADNEKERLAWTPLMACLVYGRTSFFAMLVKRGANANLYPEGVHMTRHLLDRQHIDLAQLVMKETRRVILDTKDLKSFLTLWLCWKHLFNERVLQIKHLKLRIALNLL